MSDFFEDQNTKQKDSGVFLVSVYWVGQSLKSIYNPNKRVIDALKLEMPGPAKDGSSLWDSFVVTSKGELLNIIEHLTLITSNESTQVMYFEDLHSDMSSKIQTKHITSTFIQELVFDDRSGRSRLHYFHLAKPEVIHQIFTDYKEKHQKLFKLPECLTIYPVIWSPEPASMLYDMRSKEELSVTLQGKSRKTFNTTVEVWNERPKIEACKKYEKSKWTDSI